MLGVPAVLRFWYDRLWFSWRRRVSTATSPRKSMYCALSLRTRPFQTGECASSVLRLLTKLAPTLCSRVVGAAFLRYRARSAQMNPCQCHCHQLHSRSQIAFKPWAVWNDMHDACRLLAGVFHSTSSDVTDKHAMQNLRRGCYVSSDGDVSINLQSAEVFVKHRKISPIPQISHLIPIF